MQPRKPTILAAALGIAVTLGACAPRPTNRLHGATATASSLSPDLSTLRGRLTTVESKSTTRGIVLVIPDAFFEVDKADLNAGGRPDLMAIAVYLKEHPGQKALIEGHTDSDGSDAHNGELSLRRSTAVEAFLLRNGVDPERLEVRGLGERHPIASNRTPAGRQQNRRVEIVVLDADHTVADRQQRDLRPR